MTCLTNTGYADGECIRATAARNIAIARLAALTLIATDNANQAIDNFRKQWRIAKRGLEIAKEEQGHLETTYWPRELSFLAEFGPTGGAHDGVEVIESVEVLGRRYAGRLISAVADRFAKRIDEVKANYSRYATSSNRKALQDLLLARSQTIASARVLGRNIAWAEVMSREETDWNRRQAAVAMGKGLVQQAQSLMQSAGAIYGELGQRALDGLNDAMRGIGNSFQTIRNSQMTIAGARNNPFPTESETAFDWNGAVTGNARMTMDSWRSNPLGVNSYLGGTQPAWGINNRIGLLATATDMSSIHSGNSFIDNSGNDTGTKWNSSMSTGQSMFTAANQDMQMSPGVVGTSDLVRSGEAVFTVNNNTVTVDMNKFGFAYADGQTSGELATKPTLPPI